VPGDQIESPLNGLQEWEGQTAELRVAIVHYRAELKRVTRRLQPLAWAKLKFDLANALVRVGERDSDARALHAAVSAYRAALTVRTKTALPAEWARTKLNLGTALLNLGDLETTTFRIEEAIKHFRAAQTIFSARADRSNWALIQSNLGNAYFKLGERNFDPAILRRSVRHHRAALKGRPRDQYPLLWAMTKNNLATTLQVIGHREQGVERLEQSVALYREALGASTRTNAPFAWAMAQCNLASALQSIGERQVGTLRLEESVVAYRESLKERQQNDFPVEWAATQHNLGTALLELGGRTNDVSLLLEAAACTRTALTVWSTRTNPMDASMAMTSLGRTLLRLGNLTGDTDRIREAIAEFRKALPARRRRHAIVQWASSIDSIGGAYLDLGQWTLEPEPIRQAIMAYQRALRVRRQHEVPALLTRTLNGLGDAQLTLADLTRDSKLAGKALKAFEHVLQESDRDARPIEWASFKRNVGDTLFLLAELKGPAALFEAAEQAYRDAVEGLVPGADDVLRASIHSEHGEVLFSLGRFAEAANAYRAALVIRDALAEQALVPVDLRSIVRLTGDLGSKLAFCHFLSGDPTQGLSDLEWARGIELRRALSPGLAKLQNLNVADRQRMERTQNRLQRLQSELTDAVVGQPQIGRSAVQIAGYIRKARDAMAKMFRDAGVTIGSAGRLLPVDVLDLVPVGGVLVVPIVTRAGGMAYVIPHAAGRITATHVVDLPSLRLDTVDSLARRWLDAYRAMMSLAKTGATRPWAVFTPVLNDTLDRLWDLLMGPVLELARKCGVGSATGREIIIVPTGDISLLPLHAAREPGTGRFVIDDFVVSYEPSLLSYKIALERAARASASCPTFLGLFNPQGNDEGLSLPLSETSEWPQIRHCFGDRAKPLFRSDATIDALLNEAPSRQYLHFSCHGTFDPVKPDLSGLVLASNQRVDVRRIVGTLRLPHCRMVATAACETALTATGRLSEEQIGVPAAFLQTGAAAVVATLWPVVDRSTARVMGRMYELHLNERMRPAEALRQAMLDLRHGRLVDISQTSAREEAVTFRHARPDDGPPESAGATIAQTPDYASPFFWAGFVLIGA
jgi:tetratricopeptide (TPR) repeat protein